MYVRSLPPLCDCFSIPSLTSFVCFENHFPSFYFSILYDRRSAILSFLSRLPGDEMCHLTHLMLRGVLPQSTLLKAAANIATTISSTTSITTLSSLTDRSHKWYTIVSEIALNITKSEIYYVSWERQIGFLHLLEQAVRLIGFGISSEVGVLLKVVLAMLGGSQMGAWKGKGGKSDEGQKEGEGEGEEAAIDGQITTVDNDSDSDSDDVIDKVMDIDGEEEVEGSEGVAGYHRDVNQSSKVRSMSLLRLSEMVHQFHSTFPFTSFRSELLIPLGNLIPALPSAITGSSKPPGLLRLLSAFVRYDETINVVILDEIKSVQDSQEIVSTTKKSKKSNSSKKALLTKEIEKEKEKEEEEICMRNKTDVIVETLIRCVAARAEFEVSRMVMDIITILLERNDGSAILPHAELIIKCFSKRFVGPDFDDSPGVSAQLKLSEMKIAPTGSVKQGEKKEVQLLKNAWSLNGRLYISFSTCVSLFSSILFPFLSVYFYHYLSISVYLHLSIKCLFLTFFYSHSHILPASPIFILLFCYTILFQS